MKKEKEILEALKKGMNIKQISDSLNVTKCSVLKLRKDNPDLFPKYSGKGLGGKVVDKKPRYSFRIPKNKAIIIDAHIDKNNLNPTLFFNTLVDEWAGSDH